MSYRIRVGKVDSAGDVPVMLEESLWLLPIWRTVERTWVYNVKNREADRLKLELEAKKIYLKNIAEGLSCPVIKPHTEVLDV